jgi:SAM-dependent methyltransferase
MNAGPASYDPRYFPLLYQVEDRHFWFRGRNLAIAAMVKRSLPDLPPGCRVLECGCGTGNVLQMLERLGDRVTVVGMDLFAEGLLYARQRTRAFLVQGDLHSPPFGVRFDLVGLFDVLEHMPDDHQVLRDLRALVADGGRLLLTVPAHPQLWSYFDEASHHCRRYKRDELLEKLHEAGYEAECVTYLMASLLAAAWLGRRLAALLGSRPAGQAARADQLAARELRTLPVVNAALELLLRMEAGLLAYRGSLPWGTSLLVTARLRQDR